MPNLLRKPITTFHARRLSVALSLLTIGFGTIGAQQASEGPMVLRLPVNARIAAMANAGIAASDGDAVLYNPGMLSVARGVALSLHRFEPQATSGAFGSVIAVGGFTYGFGVHYLDWRAPVLSYTDVVGTGGVSRLTDSGVVAASSAVFAVGAARTIKGIRLGVAVKYADERFGANQDGVVAVDFGASRPMGPGSLALVAQNFGNGVRLDGEEALLPRRIGLGFGGGMYPLHEYFDLGAQMQLAAEGDDWFVRPSAGVEVGYVPIEGVALVVRVGARRPREVDESAITGGLGFTVDRYSVDYAFEPSRAGSSGVHRIGMRIR